MKKIFLIGWKDVILAFRDRAALILMLAAPFLLTLGLGFVTGRLVRVIQQRLEQHSRSCWSTRTAASWASGLVELFQSTDLAELVTAHGPGRPGPGPPAGRPGPGRRGDHHPGRVHRQHHPGRWDCRLTGAVVQIELYTNPTRPTSVGVIKTILEEFISRVEVGRVGGQVAVTQLVQQRPDPAPGCRPAGRRDRRRRRPEPRTDQPDHHAEGCHQPEATGYV